MADELTAEWIPFSKPWIGREEIEAVTECLESLWLTTGPRVREFEAKFAEYVGCKYAVAVNSCTAALHLALEAIGVKQGDEVLVPTVTFAATAEVVTYLGARPVLLDCDPVTLNLDPDTITNYLETRCVRKEDGWYNRETDARVKAVIPVHFAGLPCDMDRIMAIAQSNRLEVIEDAAHTLPAVVSGRSVGTFGRIGAFSFYATKNVSTGEGGMLTTDDQEIADRARMMCLHGISRDAWLRYTARGSWYYEILEPGFKYNMTDMAAALGLVQLGRSEMLWGLRNQYAAKYSAALRRLDAIEVPAEPGPGVQHSWHLYPIRLHLDRLTIDRAAFITELKEMGIGTSVHFIPLHLHPYYRDRMGYTPEDLPVATREYPRLISLPLYPRMQEAELDRVIEAVSKLVCRFAR